MTKPPEKPVHLFDPNRPRGGYFKVTVDPKTGHKHATWIPPKKD